MKSAVAILFVSLVLWGCGSSSTTETTDGKQQLNVVVSAKLTDDQVAQLPEGFTEAAESVGWKRVPDGFQQLVPASEVKISDGVNSVSTDAKGYFVPIAGLNTQSLKIVTDNNEIPIKVSRAVTKSITGATTEKVTYSVEIIYCDCCNTADNNDMTMDYEQHSTSKSSSSSQLTHCLDYNGWFSDGKIYPKDTVKFWKNFMGSDCEFAIRFPLTNCWLDPHTKGGCKARFGSGYCTKAIGCPTRYHTHYVGTYIAKN